MAIAMIPFSILDLSPISEGHSVREALDASRKLAQAAEKNGYRRFWLAEHHGMPGIASAATSILISHVAAGTHSIRVGAGGIIVQRGTNHLWRNITDKVCRIAFILIEAPAYLHNGRPLDEMKPEDVDPVYNEHKG